MASTTQPVARPVVTPNGINVTLPGRSATTCANTPLRAFRG
jgi:hypothetical protein